MVLSKKIYITIIACIFAAQVLGMGLCRSLIRLRLANVLRAAKSRPVLARTTQRSSVARPILQTKSLMQAQSRNITLTVSAAKQHGTPIQQRRFNAKGATFGAGLTLAALYGVHEKAHCHGGDTVTLHVTNFVKPCKSYAAPFEESRKKFYASLEAKPWGEVAKKYIKQLQEEEAEVLNEVIQLIDPDESIMQRDLLFPSLQSFIAPLCLQQELHLVDALKKQNQDIPKRLREFINRELEQCCMDPKAVTVLEKELGIPADGQASQKSIMASSRVVSFFDEERYPHYPYHSSMPIMKLTFAHEIQHLLHNDIVMQNAIKNIDIMLQYKHGPHAGKFVKYVVNEVNKQKLEIIKQKFLKFTEKRSDILACLISPEHAQGGIDWTRTINDKLFVKAFLWYYKRKGFSEEDIFGEHPALSQRKAYMEQVLKEMQQAIAKK